MQFFLMSWSLVRSPAETDGLHPKFGSDVEMDDATHTHTSREYKKFYYINEAAGGLG